MLLTGRGCLLALATVHVHSKPTPKTPFTVVEVLMEGGPVVRGLLGASQSLPLHPGITLVTILEETVDSEGEPALDLRFKAAEVQTVSTEKNS